MNSSDTNPAPWWITPLKEVANKIWTEILNGFMSYLDFVIGLGGKTATGVRNASRQPWVRATAAIWAGLIVAGTVIGLLMTVLSIIFLAYGWLTPTIWLMFVAIVGNLIAFALLGFGREILAMLALAVIMVKNLLGDAPLRLTEDMVKYLASAVGVSFNGLMVVFRSIVAALPGDITKELPAFEAPDWKQPMTEKVFGEAKETLEHMKTRVESWGKAIRIFFEANLGFETVGIFILLTVTAHLRLLVTFSGMFILACTVYHLVTKPSGSWRIVAKFAIWLIVLSGLGLGALQYTGAFNYMKTLGDQRITQFKQKIHSETFVLAGLQSVHVATVVSETARTYQVTRNKKGLWQLVLDQRGNTVRGYLNLRKGERFPYLLNQDGKPTIVTHGASSFALLTKDNGGNVPQRGYEFAVLTTDIK